MFRHCFLPPQFWFGPRSPPWQRRTPQALGTPTDQEKFHGYADALCDAGLDINDVPMVQADPWDRDAARMMLDAAPNATAILSMSAMQAIAVINEARRRGLSVRYPCRGLRRPALRRRGFAAAGIFAGRT